MLSYKKKTILVTGGAGFVGSNLVRALRNDGADVFVLDNLSTGYIDEVVGSQGVVIGEVRDINSLVPVRPDYVFHLGEYSRVEQSFDDIDIVFEANLNSIYSVLKFCRDRSSKLIYAGSSTKFGDGGDTKFQSPYALTKSINTEIVQTFCSWFGMEYAITYFYNVYGQREIATGKYSTVVANFLNLVRSGAKLLPVVRPGTQIRNFTHVSDIVEGLKLVALSGRGDGYGIGSDDAVSILELVEMLGCTPELIPERRGNRISASVNTGKTKALGWLPRRRLQDYIKEEISKC